MIIWTCREREHLEAVKEWFAERDFWPDAFNENIDCESGFAERKIYADVYIDDRNFPPFEGWDTVLDAMGID